MFVFAPLASAQTIEVVVEGNGAGSDNTAQQTSTNEVVVEQENTSQSSTNVSLTASTGDNTADGNNGEVEITTGDVSTATQVTTTTNSNQATIECCAAPTTQTTISGNGAGSTNTTNTTNTNSIKFASNNTATTTNTINISENTGGNSANNNGGNVSITTGNIETLIKTNTFGNVSTFSYLGCCTEPETDTFKIKGNGADSQNSITHSTNNVFVVVQNNNSIIDNLILLALNTGNNSANGNLGDVSIVTGDISTIVSIKNETNLNEAVIDLCCDDDDATPEEPEEPVTPPNPPTNGGNGGNGVKGDTTDHNSAGTSNGSGTGGAGEVFESVKNMLPATGANNLIYMLIANLLMFWLGCYLRLRSGRAPALATC
jgi:hypothetical protein